MFRDIFHNLASCIYQNPLQNSMKTVKELIDLMTLEQIDDRLFRGTNYKTPWKRVFGGQVLGQALHAAYQTVPDDRFAHSLHGYFILAGDIDRPVIYEVESIRNGGSFTTRRVTAIQRGKAIFIMAASFQLRQPGFEHQISQPNVPPPDSLLPDTELYKQFKETHPELYKRYMGIHPNAIEFRPVERIDPTKSEPAQPYRNVWIRTNEKTEVDLPMQQQLLAYASDYQLLGTAFLPHRGKIKKVMSASLDHAIWFHREFRMDDWLLYALDSPSTSNSRGFSRGNLFDQSGRLVASVVQEGLIRDRTQKPVDKKTN